MTDQRPSIYCCRVDYFVLYQIAIQFNNNSDNNNNNNDSLWIKTRVITSERQLKTRSVTLGYNCPIVTVKLRQTLYTILLPPTLPCYWQPVIELKTAEVCQTIDLHMANTYIYIYTDIHIWLYVHGSIYLIYTNYYLRYCTHTHITVDWYAARTENCYWRSFKSITID